MQNDGEATPPGASQGVQVGDGNLQINAWSAKTPVNPVSLGALSTSKAVARLRRESPDDVADVFGASSPNNVAEVLKGLLREDEPKAIAALAGLSLRKAGELIRPVESEFPWLTELPEAAQAMAARAKELGGEIGEMERVPVSLAGRNGYSRVCKEGVIYWTGGNAYAVSERIADYYTDEGGPCGALGFPAEDATRVESPGRARGTKQNFQTGTIYSSDSETHSVSGKIDTAYQAVGGPAGWLGFPVAGQQQDTDERGNQFEVQRFEGGLIYLSAMGTIPVRSEVARHTEGWLPESQETRTKMSPVSGRLGTGQGFWRPPHVRMAVYSIEDVGTYRVRSEIREYYEGMKGPESTLGFPVSAHSVNQGKGWFQDFEGGRIYVSLGTRTPVMVPAPTLELLKERAALAEQIGWPVEEEKPVGQQPPNGPRECMQRFEHGIVTGRGRQRQIWVQPPGPWPSFG